MKRIFSLCLTSAITVVMLFCLTGCNSDVNLGKEENIPEVAEHLLGMPVNDAMKYLETQGFLFGNKADYSNEYVFSRDGSLSEFSYEATAMLMFGVFNGDTIKYVDAVQRPKTEKDACKLYKKWSRYTALVTLPKVKLWKGDLIVKNLEKSTLKDKRSNYIDGSAAKEMVESYQQQYKNGEITKENYDMWMTVYSRNREQFWEDLEREQDNIDTAMEHYTDNTLPKEVELILYTNNGGSIELYYETHNFVWQWE